MNMKEIEQKIFELQQEFNSQAYPLPLPKTFIEVFKKAFMVVSPQQHKLPLKVCRIISEKKVEELTIMEVGQMTNLIISAKPENLYKDFKTALVNYEALNNIVIDYNIMSKEKESELNAKKVQLMELAGVGVKRPKIYQA